MVKDGKPVTLSVLRPLLCQGYTNDQYYDVEAVPGPGESLLDDCHRRFGRTAIELTEHTHCMLTNDALESVPDG